MTKFGDDKISRTGALACFCEQEHDDGAPENKIYPVKKEGKDQQEQLCFHQM